MATTPSSLLINFDLHNADEEQVLFITDDVAGQEMTLEISNTSDKPTSPKKLTGKASATVHHFELVFRPSTLYNNPPAIKLAGTQFELFMDKDNTGKIKPNADGTLSLYFKSKGDWTLQEGEKIALKLNQIRAAAEGGTRGTRVMLKYRNLLHAGASQTFSGFREMHLSLVNHRGKRNIPLHVGFVGSNTVLNDGKHPNDLKLRITNASRKSTSIAAAATSKLVLVLEGGPSSSEWTMATKNQLNGIIIKYTHPGVPSTIDANKAEGANAWEIPFVKLDKGQVIDIQITGLITNHKTGHTNLFLHYENIPGYWDGEYVEVIEKTPLVFRNKNVGIGTDIPSSKLDISGAGGLRVSTTNQGSGASDWIAGNFGGTQGDRVVVGLLSGKATVGAHNNSLNAWSDLILQADVGNVGIGTSAPSKKLEVNGNIKLTGSGKGIQFIDAVTAGGVVAKGTVGAISYTEMRIGFPGPAFVGRLTIGKWSTSSQPKFTELVRIQHDGNVGIGTTTPTARLHVINKNQNAHGNTLILGPTNESNLRLGYDKEYSWVQSHGLKPLAINPAGNKVGIGTTGPGKTLDIMGPGGLRVSTTNNGSGTSDWIAGNFGATKGDRVVVGLLNGKATIGAHNNSLNAWSDLILQSEGGRVGIGTTSPVAPLQVEGYFETSLPSGNRNEPLRLSNTSIQASHAMVASEFNARSDQRIKNIMGRSNTQRDLETLQQIEVTDFTYLDVAAHGNQPHKKLIAQQVQAVYPQAVNACKDFIPDIYAMSATTTYHSERQQLSVTMPKAHSLTQGDCVRIADDQGSHEVDVREVKDNRTFIVDHNRSCEEVFVFGKKVDDLLTLDYEAVAMLNVSATQELQRSLENQQAKVDEQDQRIAVLEAENASLREQIQELKGLAGRMAKIEARLNGSANGVAMAP